MEIVILSASLIVACLAGLLVNTALVKTYDPRGAESSARARTRAEEAKEREGSRKTWLTSVGEMASSVMPMAKSQENAIALRLARAGIKTTVAMYWAAVLLSAATGIVMGAGLALIIDGTVLAKFAIAALFLLIGFVAPRFYVAVKTRRRAEEIEASLPPTLELLSVVVEAGQTVERGIKEIATLQIIIAILFNRSS